ncbi:unnamed protein product [Cuscuta europaea]|uniref:Uncharacterized protein n=1 Tax=Cuscuta europaea TaxID=41803 RepID=A0A9P0ZCQ9_CUSEU|nr:unnamed protein product [Cuscuta europaea]
MVAQGFQGFRDWRPPIDRLTWRPSRFLRRRDRSDSLEGTSKNGKGYAILSDRRWGCHPLGQGENTPWRWETRYRGDPGLDDQARRYPLQHSVRSRRPLLRGDAVGQRHLSSLFGARKPDWSSWPKGRTDSCSQGYCKSSYLQQSSTSRKQTDMKHLEVEIAGWNPFSEFGLTIESKKKIFLIALTNMFVFPRSNRDLFLQLCLIRIIYYG